MEFPLLIAIVAIVVIAICCIYIYILSVILEKNVETTDYWTRRRLLMKERRIEKICSIAFNMLI